MRDLLLEDESAAQLPAVYRARPTTQAMQTGKADETAYYGLSSPQRGVPASDPDRVLRA